MQRKTGGSDGHKENAKLSAAHLRPLQPPHPVARPQAEEEQDSLEFASPRAPTSTVGGDKTPQALPSPHALASHYMSAGAPAFLNQGESESGSEHEACCFFQFRALRSCAAQL